MLYRSCIKVRHSSAGMQPWDNKPYFQTLTDPLPAFSLLDHQHCMNSTAPWQAKQSPVSLTVCTERLQQSHVCSRAFGLPAIIHSGGASSLSRAIAIRLLTSARVAICQWWHNCMNFERLAGSEPRRRFGDMVLSRLIAALRFTGGCFIVSPGMAQPHAKITTDLLRYVCDRGICARDREMMKRAGNYHHHPNRRHYPSSPALHRRELS
jgi:hypothetical protein